MKSSTRVFFGWLAFVAYALFLPTVSMCDEPPGLNGAVIKRNEEIKPGTFGGRYLQQYDKNSAAKDGWLILCYPDKPARLGAPATKGGIRAAQQYSKGKLHGTSLLWDQSGNLVCAGEWRDDFPYEGEFLMKDVGLIVSDGYCAIGDMKPVLSVFQGGNRVFLGTEETNELRAKFFRDFEIEAVKKSVFKLKEAKIDRVVKSHQARDCQEEAANE